MPSAFGVHGEAAMMLGATLGQHVLANNLGELYAATGFLVERDPDSVRAPDIAYIHAGSAPARNKRPGWMCVMPDALVEVVRPCDRVGGMPGKTDMWLNAGVRLVWVVYPTRKAIEAHRPGRPVLALGVSDALDGYDVVPGFTAPVARVFA